MSVLNSEHIERILTEVEAMQEDKVLPDGSEDDKKGNSGIISRVKDIIKAANTPGDR